MRMFTCFDIISIKKNGGEDADMKTLENNGQNKSAS